MHSGPVYTTYYTKLARVLDIFPIPSFVRISGSVYLSRTVKCPFYFHALINVQCCSKKNLGQFGNVILVILFVFFKNMYKKKLCKNIYNIVTKIHVCHFHKTLSTSISQILMIFILLVIYIILQ